MALRTYLSQNESNDKVGVVGNWYLRADNNPPITLTDVAKLIKEHNIGVSEGTIIGVLTDFVNVVRTQVLNGQPVKIDGLAIFKASIENRGGWSNLKDVSLHIGGENDNVQSIRLLAQATGDFTRVELSKDGKLVLDRASARLVKAAGGTVEDDTTTDTTDQQGGGTTPSGDGTPGEGYE